MSWESQLSSPARRVAARRGSEAAAYRPAGEPRRLVPDPEQAVGDAQERLQEAVQGEQAERPGMLGRAKEQAADRGCSGKQHGKHQPASEADCDQGGAGQRPPRRVVVAVVVDVREQWGDDNGTEVINRRGPWRTVEAVELATLDWGHVIQSLENPVRFSVSRIVSFLALIAVPLWLWRGRGKFEAILVFLPALYAHGAYAIVTRFLPRFAEPQIPLVAGFAYRPFSWSPRPTRFGRKYREVLGVSSLVDVAVGTSVVGFDANASRSTVTSITCFRHAAAANERLDLVPAQNVIVAGGGISNAQLFLQPRADGAIPVGNESGLAGKYLMEHPHLNYVGEVVLDDDLEQQSRPTDFGPAHDALVPVEDLMRRQRLLACSVQCHDRTTDHAMARYLAGVYGKPFHHYLCSVIAEMAPALTNQVFLTGERDATGLYRPAARCVIGAGDFLNVETTLRLLGDSLIASEKGRLRIDNERLYREPTGGGHIMGTTRMGTSRSNSVVDSNCRVHGYDNLFVAGSSVFPTGGYANPTLTIVALAIRLADTLTAAA